MQRNLFPHKACLDYLDYRGIMAWRNNNMGVYDKTSGTYFFHGRKGVSDIIGVLDDGRILCVECKRPGGKMTPDQQLFLNDVQRHGGVAVCVTSMDELASILDSLPART